MTETFRVREVITIDRKTGEITQSSEILTTASFDQRMAELKASVPFDGAEQKCVRLQCNGCGHVEVLDSENPKQPAGWTENGDGDFCQECSS